jgi:hypothetical protein
MIPVRRLDRNRSGSQRAVRSVQHTDCCIERLLLLEIVSTRLEQFSGALGNYFVRFRDTVREFCRVCFYNGGLVERLPILFSGVRKSPRSSLFLTLGDKRFAYCESSSSHCFAS